MVNNSTNILDLEPSQAREFLMRGTSYCSVALPKYFKFDSLLTSVAEAVGNNTNPSDYCRKEIRKLDDVNYCLISNKDGKYAWRRFDLIHPLIYVLMVECITEEDSWKLICKRFQEFKNNNVGIKCVSLPVKPEETEKTSAAQVKQW